jgi:hypothetical protein
MRVGMDQSDKPDYSVVNVSSDSVPHLAEALAAAIKDARAVGKDGVNKFHDYSYASAEGILTEARRVMGPHGISLVPVETNVSESHETLWHCRVWRLAHSSGEAISITTKWPVIPGKGRPLDKALAVADTSALRYLLRDILLIPACDATEEMNARDDREHAHSKRPEAPVRPAQPKPPKDPSQWGRASILAMHAAGLSNEARENLAMYLLLPPIEDATRADYDKLRMELDGRGELPGTRGGPGWPAVLEFPPAEADVVEAKTVDAAVEAKTTEEVTSPFAVLGLDGEVLSALRDIGDDDRVPDPVRRRLLTAGAAVLGDLDIARDALRSVEKKHPDGSAYFVGSSAREYAVWIRAKLESTNA